MSFRLIKLKINHAIEIGAAEAYRGHYKRTGDIKIFQIHLEELRHKAIIKTILANYNETSYKILDGIFYCIGYAVSFLCQIAPVWSLNLVARGLELFAVFSYRNLAKEFPIYTIEFEEMAESENNHYDYFKR